jgi:hypothetical protein
VEVRSVPTSDCPSPKKPKKPIHREGEHAHAVATARGLLIARVEAMLPEVVALVVRAAGDGIPDLDARELLAIQVIQALLVRLFPEEFAGSAYTPDPKKRLAVPAVAGLIPRVFTQAAEYTSHLERGRQSPAASLRDDRGQRLLSDAELARLGQRQGRRAGAGAKARGGEIGQQRGIQEAAGGGESGQDSGGWSVSAVCGLGVRGGA